MEYIPYGDLGHFLKTSGRFSVTNVKQITRQLLEGLAMLHGLNITHRDMKPQVRTALDLRAMLIII